MPSSEAPTLPKIPQEFEVVSSGHIRGVYKDGEWSVPGRPSVAVAEHDSQDVPQDPAHPDQPENQPRDEADTVELPAVQDEQPRPEADQPDEVAESEDKYEALLNAYAQAYEKHIGQKESIRLEQRAARKFGWEALKGMISARLEQRAPDKAGWAAFKDASRAARQQAESRQSEETAEASQAPAASEVQDEIQDQVPEPEAETASAPESTPESDDTVARVYGSRHSKTGDAEDAEPAVEIPTGPIEATKIDEGELVVSGSKKRSLWNRLKRGRTKKPAEAEEAQAAPEQFSEAIPPVEAESLSDDGVTEDWVGRRLKARMAAQQRRLDTYNKFKAANPESRPLTNMVNARASQFFEAMGKGTEKARTRTAGLLGALALRLDAAAVAEAQSKLTAKI